MEKLLAHLEREKKIKIVCQFGARSGFIALSKQGDKDYKVLISTSATNREKLDLYDCYALAEQSGDKVAVLTATGKTFVMILPGDKLVELIRKFTSPDAKHVWYITDNRYWGGGPKPDEILDWYN